MQNKWNKLPLQKVLFVVYYAGNKFKMAKWWRFKNKKVKTFERIAETTKHTHKPKHNKYEKQLAQKQDGWGIFII